MWVPNIPSTTVQLLNEQKWCYSCDFFPSSFLLYHKSCEEECNKISQMKNDKRKTVPPLSQIFGLLKTHKPFYWMALLDTWFWLVYYKILWSVISEWQTTGMNNRPLLWMLFWSQILESRNGTNKIICKLIFCVRLLISFSSRVISGSVLHIKGDSSHASACQAFFSQQWPACYTLSPFIVMKT